MAGVRVGRRQMKLHHQASFLGGFAFPAKDDAEAEQFQNFELGRDGYPIGRLGVVFVNSNDINSEPIVGIGRFTTTPSNDILFIVKQGTNWFTAPANAAVTGLGAPVAFTAITSTQNPLEFPVAMEQCVLVNGTTDVVSQIELFTSANFTTLLSNFANSSGTVGTNIVNVVANSKPNLAGGPAPPGGCQYIRQAGPNIFLSGQIATTANGVTNPQPITIFFSNVNDPLSWPTNNFIVVPGSRGAVTGLERLSSGQLIIFTERSILSLLGNVPLNFSLTVIHEDIGCDSPNTISTLGNTIVFAFNGDLYTYTGGLNSITEKLRGLTLVPFLGNNDLPANNPQSAYCQLTPNFLFYRPSLNVNVANTSPPSSDTPVATANLMLVLDRQRSGWWSVWQYANGTDFNSSLPPLPVIYMDNNNLIMGGGDGNVYAQTFRTIDFNNLTGVFEAQQGFLDTLNPANLGSQLGVFSNDCSIEGGTPVTSVYRSRLNPLNDAGLQKTHARIQFDGTCKAGTATLLVRIMLPNGTFLSATRTGLSMPFEANSLATTFTPFKFIQVQVSAQNMQLFSYDIHYMELALSALGTITGGNH